MSAILELVLEILMDGVAEGFGGVVHTILRSRTGRRILGLSILAGAIIFQVLSADSHKPVGVEALTERSITYRSCYLKGAPNDVKIVLEASDRVYAIDCEIWKCHSQAGEWMEKLNRRSEAKVWVWQDAPGTIDVWGIESQALRLAPEIGVSRGQSNNRVFFWLAMALYAVGGGFVLSSFAGRKPARADVHHEDPVPHRIRVAEKLAEKVIDKKIEFGDSRHGRMAIRYLVVRNSKGVRTLVPVSEDDFEKAQIGMWLERRPNGISLSSS